MCVDIFSQVSDSHGAMVMSKFDWYLREVLKLPAAVNEGPSFSYNHTTARSCFPQQVKIIIIVIIIMIIMIFIIII